VVLLLVVLLLVVLVVLLVVLLLVLLLLLLPLPLRLPPRLILGSSGRNCVHHGDITEKYLGSADPAEVALEKRLKRLSDEVVELCEQARDEQAAAAHNLGTYGAANSLL